MKALKYVIIIVILGTLLFLGEKIYTSSGKIEVELYDETGANTAEVMYRSINLFEDKGDGKSDNIFVRESFKKTNLKNFAEEGINFKFSAKEGYQLVAYDGDGNKLGVINYFVIDDGFAYNTVDADFDYDNYLGSKYFKVVAEKIKK